MIWYASRLGRIVLCAYPKLNPKSTFLLYLASSVPSNSHLCSLLRHSTHPSVRSSVPQPYIADSPNSCRFTQGTRNVSMESVGSNSPAVATAEEASTRRVANRIIRALQHQLQLLHRAGPDFFVLGATGNVYTVTLATTPACTCADPAVPCKHILFVLLRVLGLSLDEACVWRQSLPPCQVARLVGTPTYTDVLAGSSARARFHQLWSARVAAAKADHCRRQEPGATSSGRLDGAACPVCLEEMSPPPQAQAGAAAAGQALLTCGTCRNSVHAECFARWKRSRARRAATCVVCRARWRQPSQEQEQQYMNLSAYMNEANDIVMQSDDGGLCAV